MRHAKQFAQLNSPEVVAAKAEKLVADGATFSNSVLLNPEEAADLIGIKPELLSGWRALNEGPPYFKLGRNGNVRYLLSEVLDYIEQRRAMLKELERTAGRAKVRSVSASERRVLTEKVRQQMAKDRKN